MNNKENCDICYDDCYNVIALECCNKSKKVCKVVVVSLAKFNFDDAFY